MYLQIHDERDKIDECVAANVNAAVSKLGGADNYQTKVWWQRRDK